MRDAARPRFDAALALRLRNSVPAELPLLAAHGVALAGMIANRIDMELPQFGSGEEASC